MSDGAVEGGARLLLLDVDGAVSPLPCGPTRSYPEGVEWVEVASVFGEVVIDARLRQWLHQHLASCELVWATTWGVETANDLLAGPLCLPHLRGIDFGSVSEGRATMVKRQYGARKPAAVREFICRRSAAWLDDSITLEAIRWARRRKDPALFLPTNSSLGITERHVNRLERWAESLHDTESEHRSCA